MAGDFPAFFVFGISSLYARGETMTQKHIQIYDTTLRDGSQSEEISFTVDDKLRIAQKLDGLGIDYIEGGWPGSNPKDTEFFIRAKKELKLTHSKLAAFGSTKRAGNKVEEDPVLQGLIASEAPVICIFGKTWDLHVTTALRISLEENLDLIRESVAYLKSKKKEVLFDAEHFFDGYINNPDYALKALKAAVEGGADRLVLCDTNGGTLPDILGGIVKKVHSTFKNVPLGIHCHNDCGVAVYNSMLAVENGVTQVQGTINGIGERCGNANLCTVMANLEIKKDYHCVGKKIGHLTSVARFVDELANRVGDRHQPYVGKSAFAHKGGVHVQAILKDSKTYEHIDPKQVGNEQRILISDLSGAATMAFKAKSFGIDLASETSTSKTLLAKIKEAENQGYQFEGAEASFEILALKVLGKFRAHFVLKDFKVTDQVAGGVESEPHSKAIIHLEVDGKEEKCESLGLGPVHAIDKALRKALEGFYPELKQVKLLDYKVRVLPAGEGTGAYVRVLIEFGDDDNKWTTVGVSPNIIHASYKALVDGIEYKLLKK